MIDFISIFNLVMLLIFYFCYFYQVIYVFISLFKKNRYEKTQYNQHKYAALICARNERLVIAQLIKSIQDQNYPRELIDIYVAADNCTDDTADIARGFGAQVMERNNKELIGKGYALNYLFKKIDESVGITAYDAYVVFDADNVLEPNYFEEMNKVFDNGYRVITSYRNSKNYDSNWISAGYALWFLRESKYLNGARMKLSTSCAISGTGFLVSSDIIQKNGGWKHYLLTEDIEFSTDNIIQGEVIGFAENAMLYDEQPVKFSVSWNQRMRWTKGFYQTFLKYGSDLVKGIFKPKGFQCFDMCMTIAPATLLTLFSMLVNIVCSAIGIATNHFDVVLASVTELATCLGSIYLSLLLFGIITIVSEWKKINCKPFHKILYLFTFPIFIFTYMPIAIAAIFKKVHWQHIEHNITKDVDEIKQSSSL